MFHPTSEKSGFSFMISRRTSELLICFRRVFSPLIQMRQQRAVLAASFGNHELEVWSIFEGLTGRRFHQFQSVRTWALAESLHCMSLLCSDILAMITSSVDPTIDEIQYDVVWG